MGETPRGSPVTSTVSCDLEDDLIDEVTDVMASLDRKERSQDAVIAEEVRIHLRRYVNYNLKIRPLTIVHVIRL